jgi:putative membrane protein
MLEPLFTFLPERFGLWLDIPIDGNPRIVINVVAVLLLFFLAGYVRQALFCLLRLRSAINALSAVWRHKSDGKAVTKDELGRVFEHRFFAGVWHTFRDTLHEQDEGQSEPGRVRIRSTVPAEAVFSPQLLVDARLNVEFFKHLPGILTGIGIIGTFYGLIHGIQQFDPSLLAKARSDSAQMEKLFIGLKSLFDEVQGAFIASFFAIGAAMLVTLFEKVLLNLCYRRLEALCRLLDTLYEGGVGEDYLASLVKSSSENALQMARLKDSLVNELSGVLRNLSSQQIEQSKMLGDLLSAGIREQIESGREYGDRVNGILEQGLDDIGNKIALVTREQGTAVTSSLEQLIRSFSTRIDSAFTDRMQGLAGMMDSSTRSMREMQIGFHELLNEMRRSGNAEREELTATVVSLVDVLGTSQGQLETQMADTSRTLIAAIEQMNASAERISDASDHFSQAGHKVAEVMQRAELVSLQLARSSSLLENATNAVAGILDQYAGTRDAIAQMVGEIREMLESARQEAGMNRQLIQNMQSTVAEFKHLNAEADKSVAFIAEKLAETLAKFRADMARHDAEFHKHHADTLNLVASAYEPLAASIGGLTDMMMRSRESS